MRLIIGLSCLSLLAGCATSSTSRTPVAVDSLMKKSRGQVSHLTVTHENIGLAGKKPAPTSRFQPAVEPPMMARAESDHLSDLSQQARKPRKDSDDSGKRRRQKEYHHRGSSCSSCNNSPCTCSSTDGNDWNKLVLVFGVLTSPVWLPVSALQDDYELPAKFPDYPYADDLPGSLVLGSEYEGKTKDWMGNLQLFNVQENSDIERFGGRLVLDSASRLGLDTETNYWRETFSNGSSDQLWTGDANVVFRFAQSEKMQFRAGVGVNWLADSGRGDVGINFTYGAEWFPRKPWTVSTVFDMGTIGSGTLFHNRTTAGVMWGPMEAFAGYDYFQLGSAKFHGPVAGVGLRF